MHSNCILDSVANLLFRTMVFVGNVYTSPISISLQGLGSFFRVLLSNKNEKMCSFRSNENIHKKEDGSYYVVSLKKSPITDPIMSRQRKPEVTYYNFANFK